MPQNLGSLASSWFGAQGLEGLHLALGTHHPKLSFSGVQLISSAVQSVGSWLPCVSDFSTIIMQGSPLAATPAVFTNEVGEIATGQMCAWFTRSFHMQEGTGPGRVMERESALMLLMCHARLTVPCFDLGCQPPGAASSRLCCSHRLLAQLGLAQDSRVQEEGAASLCPSASA